MTQIVNLDQIQRLLSGVHSESLVRAMEEGFVAYSEDRAVVPLVGYLGFKTPPGDVHIKYGYIQGDDVYVVKLASGFYDNPKVGLPSSNGMMLVFSQKTGEPQAILLDEGHLTDVRTALAGALVAQYLAPAHVDAIGVLGTGTQARLQVEYLKNIVNCRKLYVWGRTQANLEQYAENMRADGYEVTTSTNIGDITKNCNLIITTTPSTSPLITVDMVRPGTHITAMGSDAKGKQELDPKILEKADILAVDSVSQCSDHGETSYALELGLIQPSKPIELGKLRSLGVRRIDDAQVTVADLTGVAVQDIQIAKLVYDLSQV